MICTLRALQCVTSLLIGLLLFALPAATSIVYGQISPTVTSTEQIDLQEQKLYLENEKLRLEIEQLDRWYTSPLWVAMFGGLIGLITLIMQLRNAANIQKEQADTAIRLKVVDMILASETTNAAKSRFAVLHPLFSDYIPADFITKIEALPGTAYQGKKVELFKALAAHPEHKDEIIGLFLVLYNDEQKTFEDIVKDWKVAYPGKWIPKLPRREKQEPKVGLGATPPTIPSERKGWRQRLLGGGA